MIRSKAFNLTDIPEISPKISPELSPESDEQLLLVDDTMFVSAFIEAGQRHGRQLICIGCGHPARPLHAVLLLLDGAEADESAGSAGFCVECYRDLSELMFHNAVVRASKDK